MVALKTTIVLAGFAASIYYGFNIGFQWAESIGGKVLLSIILVICGFSVTGFLLIGIDATDRRFNPYYNVNRSLRALLRKQ